jgi:hypothetical protein
MTICHSAIPPLAIPPFRNSAISTLPFHHSSEINFALWMMHQRQTKKDVLELNGNV